MRRRLRPIIVIAVLIALGVGAWALFLRPAPSVARTATVIRQAELSSTIRATGKVDVSGKLAVSLPAGGAVRTVTVRAGDTVRVGDVLVAMDDTRARQTLQGAQDALDAAQYALTATRTDTRTDFANTVGAEAKVRDAQRQLDDARTALGRTLVTAPVDGTILTVSVAEKQGYNQGQEAVTMANLSNLVLLADIDELDVPRLGDNRDTRILFDAFPGQPVTGKLVTVAPLATNRGGRTTYEGQITFMRPAGIDLRPGMGADITIATRTERNVLVVPDIAIETIGARTYVTVVRADGNRDRVEVRTGIRANGLVVIASGVDEGAKVALP